MKSKGVAIIEWPKDPLLAISSFDEFMNKDAEILLIVDGKTDPNISDVSLLREDMVSLFKEDPDLSLIYGEEPNLYLLRKEKFMITFPLMVGDAMGSEYKAQLEYIAQLKDKKDGVETLGSHLSKLRKRIFGFKDFLQSFQTNPFHRVLLKAVGPYPLLVKTGTKTIKSLLEEEVGLEPGDVELHYGLGRTYVAQGEPNLAVEEYKKAIELDPNFAEAHCSLGNAYFVLGEVNLSVEEYKKAIRIKPLLSEARCGLAAAYHRLGDKDSAIRELKEATEINPKDGTLHYNLGKIYDEAQKYELAKREYEKAIEITPNDYEAYHNLGKIYEAEGNNKKAVECYQRVIDLAPPQYASYVKQLAETVRRLTKGGPDIGMGRVS